MSEPREEIDQKKILILKDELEAAKRDLILYESRVDGTKARIAALEAALEVASEGMTKEQKEDFA